MPELQHTDLTRNVVTLQTLARHGDIAGLTAGYGLVVADECHQVPAAAFEDAIRQVRARRWLGLTATPYRRDKLDDLITLHVGPVRHTITVPREPVGGIIPVLPSSAPGGRPAPVLRVHPTAYRYTGDAGPSAPGGITVIYKDLISDEERNRQVTADVHAAPARGRNCLVLTSWTAHLNTLASVLRSLGHDPVTLRGGMGAKDRTAALARSARSPAGRPCWRSRPARTPGKGSTAPPWTPCSWPPRSRRKGGSSSTPGASCGPATARPPPRSTTTTTSSPACSPPPSPSAPPATPASASPTPANTPTHPTLTRFLGQGRKNRQHEAAVTDQDVAAARRAPPGTLEVLEVHTSGFLEGRGMRV